MSTYFRATSTPCSRRASTSSPWGTSIWDRGRPGRVRRTDLAVRGRADPAPVPDRGAPGARGAGPATAVRAGGLRRPHRAGGAGGGDHAGSGVADGLAAAQQGVVSGSSDGAPGRDEPGDGHVVRPRCPSDPGDLHPRVPLVGTRLHEGGMAAHDDPTHRPFRPRAGRVVPFGLGAAVLAMMVGIAVFLPQITGGAAGTGDRVGIAAFGTAAAWFLHRLGAVRADPDDAGLTVRNVASTQRLTWAEIVSVRFGPDRPWVQLDLADGL